HSWLTGSRLVSLPFSDHCDPLVSDAEEWECLKQGLEAERDKGYDYIEWRPRGSLLRVPAGFRPSQTFCFHRLDLRPSLQELFAKFHKDSVQRKIRRAEREGLTCAEGSSEELLNKFYDLQLSTRLRHGLPPQPRRWFQNLTECMGEQLNIRVASKNDTPVASILTLRFKNTLMYKYGCSDARFFNLGGLQLLLWRAIENAKESGAEELDLGRSDTDDEGLIVFKDRWAAERSQLTYFRCPMQVSRNVFNGRNWSKTATRISSHIPYCVVSTAGKHLYRHFG
ncbi:MAG TPA: GNAT family N-acetyltransferase, partial [Candidatus Bathyarchaeia archaeon]|nr:GNAT family N-acetyltransferase [Candidatus Bathyarchaeia archaeon]